MRCICCNRLLNDFEATRRNKSTGEFSDLCNTCVKEIGGEYIIRTDIPSDQVNDEDLVPKELGVDDDEQDPR